MFRELARTFAAYDTAVLSYRDVGGYPTSVRVRPMVDVANAVIHLGLVETLPIAGAPASLLAHAHDDTLWEQTSVLVRGRLVPDASTHVFVPTAIVPGIERGVGAFARFVIRSRRATRRYLDARHLPRPEVPWAEIRRLVERARRGR